MVTTPYGMNDPTKPPNREPRKCLVAGCENNSDPGSVTMLCVACCHVVATGDMTWYYANYMGKNWISDTVSKTASLKQDKRDLQDEVDELKKDIREAYILENGDVLSLNDLRTFYHENKNLKNQNLPLVHENQALTKENKALRERVEFLEKERNALVHNMDHAYNLGNGKFLTLDDLHDFYTDNKNVLNMLERHRHHITLLELQLKKANDTVKFQGENIQSLNNQLNSMEKEFTEKEKEPSKEETFSTMPRQEFEKRAEAAALKAAENVKFDTYTEGFRRGFDMGYEKAKDQYYE